LDDLYQGMKFLYETNTLNNTIDTNIYQVSFPVGKLPIAFVKTDTETQNSLSLETNYAINKRTSLNMHYLERQQLDAVKDTNQLVMSMQHNSNGGVSVKSTVVDINNQEPLTKTELNFGQPQKLQISANFTNYDSAKLVPLTDSLLGIETKYLSNNNGISFKYQENKINALLLIDAFINIDDTKIQVSMTDNGFDPTSKKQKIRDGDVWDFNILRKSSDFSIQAGLRTYNDNNWLNIGISGGSTTNNGKIALLYQDGDFVDRSTKIIPDSTLTLKYDKQWADRGKLSLDLSKIVSVRDITEGKVEFSMNF